MVELCAIFLNIVAAVEMGTRALCLHTNFVPSAATPSPISEIPAAPLDTALTLLPYNVIYAFGLNERQRPVPLASPSPDSWNRPLMYGSLSFEATQRRPSKSRDLTTPPFQNTPTK